MNNNLIDDIYKRIKLKYSQDSHAIDKPDIDAILQELDIYQTELLAQNDELKAQQELLEKANEEYELLFQNASIPYILIDGQHTIKKFNLIADEYFNFINQINHSFKIDMFLSKGQISSFYNWIDSKHYKSEPITLRFRCHDKSIKTFKVRGDIYPNTKYWIMLTLENVNTEHLYIEEIKKLEEEKYKQQQIILTQSKIAAVGEMLGNIAHQWRQPLSMISLEASNIKLSSELEENISLKELEKHADSILKHTDFLSVTIDDFRSFFSQDISKIEKFNIKDALTTLYKLVIDSLNNNHITCEKNITDIYIRNNENQIIQAMLNICNNAKDAMVEHIQDTDKRFFFVSLKQENNNAIITFKDSGGGIDRSIINKIFEPYFTTKHPSIGTGIGLYMTNQIITKHYNGSIEVNNVKYKHEGHNLTGVEFKITLPLKEPKDSLI